MWNTLAVILLEGVTGAHEEQREEDTITITSPSISTFSLNKFYVKIDCGSTLYLIKIQRGHSVAPHGVSPSQPPSRRRSTTWHNVHLTCCDVFWPLLTRCDVVSCENNELHILTYAGPPLDGDFLHFSFSAGLTVSEVKVKQMPPKPLRESAKKMSADKAAKTSKGHVFHLFRTLLQIYSVTTQKEVLRLLYWLIPSLFTRKLGQFFQFLCFHKSICEWMNEWKHMLELNNYAPLN